MNVDSSSYGSPCVGHIDHRVWEASFDRNACDEAARSVLRHQVGGRVEELQTVRGGMGAAAVSRGGLW